MRKLLLLCMAFACMQFVHPQVFSESFTSWPPSGWSFYELGEVTTPKWSSDLRGYEGQCAFQLYNSSGMLDNWMVTPKISALPSGYKLEFYDKIYFGFDYFYSGVFISKGSGNPAEGDFEELLETSNRTSNFVKSSINLDDYAGQDIYLAFRYQGKNAHDWCVDEVRIKDNSPVSDAGLNFNENNQTIQFSDTLYFAFKLKNNGNIAIVPGKQVYIQMNGLPEAVLETTVHLNEDESEEFVFKKVVAPGFYEVSVEIDTDANVDNNSLVFGIQVCEEGSTLLNAETSSGPSWILNSMLISSSQKYEGWFSYGKFMLSTTAQLISPMLAINQHSAVSFYALGNNEGEKAIIQYLDEDMTTWVNAGDSIALANTWTRYEVKLSPGASKHTKLRLVVSNSTFFSNYPYLDNIVFPTTAPLLPGPIIVSAPQSGEVGLDIDKVDMTWNVDLNQGVVNGFKIYAGTDNPPTNIYNGAITQYSNFTLNKLDYSTTYYYQIVPYNQYGDTPDCPIISFTTTDKVYLPVPFEENFNASYSLPADWRRYTGKLTGSSHLQRTSYPWDIKYYANNGSNSPSAYVNIWSNMNGWLITPEIVIGDTIHKQFLEFDITVTKWDSEVEGYFDADDTLAVVISTDGVWRKENVLYQLTDQDTVGLNLPVKIDLSQYSDTIRLGFYAASKTSTSDIEVFIDNVRISRVPEICSPEWIKVDDQFLPDFDKEVKDYVVYLPIGTSTIPVITAVAEDEHAQVSIEQCPGVSGIGTVHVVAQNPNFASTYSIEFVLLTSVADLQPGLNNLVYPNPFDDQLWFDLKAERADIHDITGKKLFSTNNPEGHIHGLNLEKGVYLLYLTKDGETQVTKIIKK